MAVDEAILEAIGRGDSPPTLRLYAWDPPCISLGYAQEHAEINSQKLVANGWQIVRRTTGGRAILHTDELTYAVVGPQDEPILAGGVLQSYQRLASALLSGLQKIGLPAEALPHSPNPASQKQPKEPICFEIPSNYEITVGGKKLLGSAQARKRAGVLQHGTLPLSGDITRITQVLSYDSADQQSAAVQRVQDRATTVENILQRSVSWDSVARALSSAFEETLGVHLKPAPLSASELAQAKDLVQQKYAHPSWTARI
jgi:lipoate-protein ligase A